LIGHLCIGYPEEEHDIPALQHQGWERRHRSGGVVIHR
jgi:5,6-dimethylbenzimidazole synthase